MASHSCAALFFITVSALSVMAGQTAPNQVIDIAIKGGKVHSASANISGGVPVIRARQGETVKLRWSSDRAMTIHLHGYNIEVRLPSNGEITMDFIARATGRFPVERHGGNGHAALLYLEVRP